MDVATIDWRKEKKEKIIKEILSNKFKSPNSKEKENIRKLLAQSVLNADFLVARNTLIVGLYFDKNKIIQSLKRGAFRYSNYINKSCIIEELIDEIFVIANELNLENIINDEYLLSVKKLSPIKKAYENLNSLILAECKYFNKKYKGKSLFKTLLSAIDFLFLDNHTVSETIDLKEISSRTKEELSSGISYLIYFIANQKTLKLEDTFYVAEEFILTGEINRILIASCFVEDYKEFEIMIEHFDYRCEIKEGNLKIVPPYEDFEKSIRLGYIMTDVQIQNDRLKVDGFKEFLSLEKLVEEVYKKLGTVELFKYTESNNYPRYRMEIPEPLYEILLENFVKTNKLFAEELNYLSHIFKEQILNYEDLSKIKVKDELTLMEFIKIKRLFTLMFQFFTYQLFKQIEIKSEVVYRSLIPKFSVEEFYYLLKKLTTTENIDTFLDLVCWEQNSDVMFDLQYHPFIYVEENILVSLTVFVHSNAIRNLYASEHKQNNTNLLSDGSIDSLVDKLSNSFTKAGIINYSQTPIPNSDIDMFAIYDDILFLFECKHSLQPTSTFDLRTTFDYVKKAEKQLDNLNEEFLNGNLQKNIDRKYGINLDNIKQVVSAIVLSNRLFNGNVLKYPIRNINEVTNFIEKGTMRTAEGVFLMWQTDTLNKQDLLNYFGKESSLVKLQYDCVDKRTMKYDLVVPSIEFDAYYMNFDDATQKVNEFTATLKKIDS